MSTDFLRDTEKEGILCEAKAQFVKVREVPYLLGLDGDPSKLFSEYKGNCTRKHLYLGDKLIQLGYKVSLGIASFDWRDLPIPREIVAILKDPTDTHLFLYASLSGNESVVDATWDRLMPETFNKNSWDGKNSTPISVPAKTIWREDFRVFQTKAMVGQMIRTLKNGFEVKRPTPFNDTFNAWLGRSK